MSVNYNRAKLNKSTCPKEYKLKQLNELYPPYWDEGLVYQKSKYHYWAKKPKKRLLFYQIRSYKTWKYNRKTQYKQ